MVSAGVKYGLPLAIITFLYQAVFRDLVFVTFGVGKQIQNVTDFPYYCRRIEHDRLQACEDMWLSDATRQLFLACSDPLARQKWMPNIALFNHSGRSLNDAVVALDIDKPTTVDGKDGFELRVLKALGYPVNQHDDHTLHLVGMTGIDSPQRVELLFVNGKPSRDNVTGEILDNTVVGANSTIEKFITGPAATQMKHVSTYAHSNIATPNNVATAAGMKGFYITNDHGLNKVGIWHQLSAALGLGDITYCDTTTPSSLQCTKLASGINFPNGLLFHPEHNLLYVPSAANGNIHVFQPKFAPGSTTPTLKKVHEIHIPYAIDNLSLDPYTGDIYAAALPKAMETIMGFNDPYHSFPPSTSFRVRLVTGLSSKLKYEVEKVIEDAGGNGTVLPAATTIVKDGKTGRLFLSGVYSPFITVCDPK